MAFLAGVVARDQNVPVAEALCAKHVAFAKDALDFVANGAGSVTS